MFALRSALPDSLPAASATLRVCHVEFAFATTTNQVK